VSGSVQSSLADSYDHGHVSSYSLKGEDFIDKISDYQLLNNVVAWIQNAIEYCLQI
jgi:hypothetical protein